MNSARGDLDPERTPLLIDATVPSTPSNHLLEAGYLVSGDEEAAPALPASPSDNESHTPISILRIVLVLLIGK
jgi:hypothetical protein